MSDLYTPDLYASNDDYIWDSWFQIDEQGQLHAYFLRANRSECAFDPEARHDRASVGHAVWNGRRWQMNDSRPALAASEGDSWDNLSIWTGSVIADRMMRQYLKFYTARRKHDALLPTPRGKERAQQIGIAVSQDLHKWTRLPESVDAPIVPNPGLRYGLDGVAWRDPYVVQWSDEQYYMFICARSPARSHDPKDPNGGGCIVYLRSENLYRWDSEPRFVELPLETGQYQLETPQVFRGPRDARGYRRVYLLYASQRNDATWSRKVRMPQECETGTYYAVSEPIADGDPRLPRFGPARLLAYNLYAAKLLMTNPWHRPVLLGFQWADRQGKFVGGIWGPHNVVFRADGSLEVDAHLRAPVTPLAA